MRRVRRTVSFAGLSKKSQIKECGLSSSLNLESGKQMLLKLPYASIQD